MPWPKCFICAGSEGLTGSWPGPGLVIYSTPPGAHDRIRPAGHGRRALAGRRRTGTPRACRGDLFRDLIIADPSSADRDVCPGLPAQPLPLQSGFDDSARGLACRVSWIGSLCWPSPINIVSFSVRTATCAASGSFGARLFSAPGTGSAKAALHEKQTFHASRHSPHTRHAVPPASSAQVAPAKDLFVDPRRPATPPAPIDYPPAVPPSTPAAGILALVQAQALAAPAAQCSSPHSPLLDFDAVARSPRPDSRPAPQSPPAPKPLVPRSSSRSNHHASRRPKPARRKPSMSAYASFAMVPRGHMPALKPRTTIAGGVNTERDTNEGMLSRGGRAMPMHGPARSAPSSAATTAKLTRPAAAPSVSTIKPKSPVAYDRLFSSAVCIARDHRFGARAVFLGWRCEDREVSRTAPKRMK
jgi:hypothetical protein